MFHPVPDPVPALKAQVAQTIVERLQGWNVAFGAAWLKTDQAKLSRIRNGQLDDFSLQRLLRMLARLGDEVTISFTSREERRIAALRAGLPPERPLQNGRRTGM